MENDNMFDLGKIGEATDIILKEETPKEEASLDSVGKEVDLSDNGEVVEETQTEAPEETQEKTQSQEEAKETGWEFKLDKFNEKFAESIGKKFENEDDFLNTVKQIGDIESLKEQIANEVTQKHQEELNAYKKIAEERDIIKHLGADGFKKFKITQSLGGDVNPLLLDKVLSGEVKSWSPLDKAAGSLMIDRPNLSVNDAKALALDKAGIDEDDDLNDLTSRQRAKLEDLAFQADKKYTEIQNMEVPELSDYETRQKEEENKRQEYIGSLTKSWEKPLENIIESFDSIEATDKIDGMEDFKFEVSKKDKKDLSELANQIILHRGIEASDQNKLALINELKDIYFKENAKKIASAQLKHLQAKLIEKEHKDVHNEKDVNTAKAPKDKAKVSQMDIIKSTGLI